MIARAMLYTAAVGVPIFVAAVLGASYLWRHGRAERWVWVAALGLSFAVPLAMMSWARSTSLSAAEAPSALVTIAPATAPPLALRPAAAEEAPPPAALDLTRRTEVDWTLLGLWLLLSGALALRWGVSAVRLGHRRRSWSRGTVDGMRVCVSEGIGPAVAGVIRPAILIPSWVLQLPANERRLVLLHENEHVRAGDPVLVALGRLARVFTPWNPLVWLMTSRLGRAVELDCDRRVLRREPDVAAYGATLLTISGRTSKYFLAAASFAESDVLLRRRILAMTTPPRAVTKAGVIGTVAAGALLMSGALRVPTPEVPWLAALQAASSVESMQGAADALPPLKVVSDPGRQQMGFILPSGEIESREVAPVGRWFPLSPDGRTGFLPVPFFPRVAWGAVDPPPSDMQPRRLTAVPEILNPSDVLKAMDEAYPTRLREQRLGGTVGVLFLVEPTGVVQQRRVGQVSAYPDLDAAALEIARAYRFSGASTEEGAVPVWVSHAIDFRVE